MWKCSEARAKITNKSWSSPLPSLPFFSQHEMNMKNESFSFKVKKFVSFQMSSSWSSRNRVMSLSLWHCEMIILWKCIVRQDLHSFFETYGFCHPAIAALSWLPLLPDFLTAGAAWFLDSCCALWWLTDSERFHLTKQLWKRVYKASLKKNLLFVIILVSLTSKKYWQAKHN